MSGAAWTSITVPAKAEPVQTDPLPYWWFHGTVETGGRFFLNNPQNAKQTANLYPGTTGGFGQAGKSLAGFYEYSDNRPGPFGNFDVALGSRDGLYLFNVVGKNVGYNDQAYTFDFSKAGQQYLTLGWDQAPHLYSTSALTPYVVNGNTVRLNAPASANTPALLAPYAMPMDIGIKRDTASGQYRWTPTDAWDIKADWSHLARTGTQVSAIRSGVTPTPSQLPKPVDDTTQNYGLSAEHVGTSPWGQQLVLKGGYKGSQYTDNYASFLAQSSTGANVAEVSTPPSNQMNSGNATVAADLPWWKSRYVGTLTYGRMTQDAAFTPINVNSSPALFSATSLGGRVNTTLFNNIVTSKITPELSNKLSYRYYDYNNATPNYFVPSTGVTFGFGLGGTNTISPGYLKQNVGDELVWRPTKEWNVGVAYGFERYDWTRDSANATNENSGKIFADWKPNSWVGTRSSVMYGNRRVDDYNYLKYVGTFQWPTATNTQIAATYRNLLMDNRETWKANFAVDLIVMPRLTITPTLKYESVDYSLDPQSQQGLKSATRWATGIDATYLISPDTSFMIGYMYEHKSELMYGCNGEGSTNTGTNQCTPYTAAAPWHQNTEVSRVHTITTAIRYAAIPNKFDTELRYSAALGYDNLQQYIAGADPLTTNGGQFTENTTWYQRLDATGIYKFDRETVAKLGWKGDVKAKLHYAWERNSATNFANDGLLPNSTTPFAGVTGNAGANMLWMGWYNPNYNVHLITASLVTSW